MIQRRLAWSLCKEDMQIRETFHIKKKNHWNHFAFFSREQHNFMILPQGYINYLAFYCCLVCREFNCSSPPLNIILDHHWPYWLALMNKKWQFHWTAWHTYLLRCPFLVWPWLPSSYKTLALVRQPFFSLGVTLSFINYYYLFRSGNDGTFSLLIAMDVSPFLDSLPKPYLYLRTTLPRLNSF